MNIEKAIKILGYLIVILCIFAIVDISVASYLVNIFFWEMMLIFIVPLIVIPLILKYEKIKEKNKQ